MAGRRALSSSCWPHAGTSGRRCRRTARRPGVARNRAELVLRGLGGLAVGVALLFVFAPIVMTESVTSSPRSGGRPRGRPATPASKAISATSPSAGSRAGLSDHRGRTQRPVSRVWSSRTAAAVHPQPDPRVVAAIRLIGVLLVIAVQCDWWCRAIAMLRHHTDDLTVSWAGFLLVMAPVAMLTAPFFTETQRWPALLGMAGGLVAARARAASAARGSARDARSPRRRSRCHRDWAKPESTEAFALGREPHLGARRVTDLVEFAQQRGVASQERPVVTQDPGLVPDPRLTLPAHPAVALK